MKGIIQNPTSGGGKKTSIDRNPIPIETKNKS